tara:strand:+ start:1237 stop:1479 length:243 start_codon:yes stop_codon:yes gene_type:complete
MENKKPCLSPELEAVITILVAACLLLCIASNNMLLALPLVLGMAFLKKHAMRCYDRKLDKFYYYAYLVSGALLALMLLSR